MFHSGVSFRLNETVTHVFAQTQKLESPYVLCNIYKQYLRKELLSSFYLNGHTLGFHSQTQKLEPGKYCSAASVGWSHFRILSTDSLS